MTPPPSYPRRDWNPKQLGRVASTNSSRPHETEVWLYLTGKKLKIVIAVHEGGVVKGTTIHTVRLPKE